MMEKKERRKKVEEEKSTNFISWASGFTSKTKLSKIFFCTKYNIKTWKSISQWKKKKKKNF